MSTEQLSSHNLIQRQQYSSIIPRPETTINTDTGTTSSVEGAGGNQIITKMPLNANSLIHLHILQSLGLLLLCLLSTPLITFIVIVSRIRSTHPPMASRREDFLGTHTKGKLYAVGPRHGHTILVTGVGMTKGLHLARAFYLNGHTVIGADVESHYVPVIGRFSRVLSHFYRLPSPHPGAHHRRCSLHTKALLTIIQRHNVALWVSCSDVAGAIEDATAAEAVRRYTTCVVVQFSVALTKMLHEKDSFMAKVEEVDGNAPETHLITSIEEAASLLHPPVLRMSFSCCPHISRKNRTGSRVAADVDIDVDAAMEAEEKRRIGTTTSVQIHKYILKPIQTNNTFPPNSSHNNNTPLTLLPLATHADTLAHIRTLAPSPRNAFVLQEYIGGALEYAAHTLIVRGRCVVFVATRSSDVCMHYAALERGSAIENALRDWMDMFAAELDEADLGEVTGHLSVDFMLLPVEGGEGEGGDSKGKTLKDRLFPIECNPRAHTAVVLLDANSAELTAAYLSVLPSTRSPESLSTIPQAPTSTLTHYWIGHDIVTRLLIPLLDFLQGHSTLATLCHRVIDFAALVSRGVDPSWCPWDPWPFWCLYCLYWPLMLLSVLLAGRWWSRANISTGKMIGV